MMDKKFDILYEEYFANIIDSNPTEYKTLKEGWLANTMLALSMMVIPPHVDADTGKSSNPVVRQVAYRDILDDMVKQELKGIKTSITSDFIWRLAKQESKFDSRAVGDKGKAKGLLQLHKDAWSDAQMTSKSKLDYNKYAHIGRVNLAVGLRYLRWIEKRFIKDTGKLPTEEQLYAAWNAGYGNLRKNGFDPNKLAKTNDTFNKNFKTFREIKLKNKV